MQKTPGDIIGVVVHGHGRQYDVDKQKDAVGVAPPRAIYHLGSKDGYDIERLWTRSTSNRLFVLQWLFLVCTIKGRAKKKRDLVLRFVDEVRQRGGEVLEIGSGRRTDIPAERRAMLSDAFEAVTLGRMPSMTNQRGRPPKQWDERARKVFDAVWPSHDYATNDDAAAAASEELGYEVTAHQIWTVKGASGRPWKTTRKR